MATKSQNTFKKKMREEAKRRKKKDKEARKQDRKELKSNEESIPSVEDPDIAGIVPGPQPLSDEWDH
ncbi:MAG TPA: hypothetical protein ENN05_09845 [Deltaproteobacteria bacterium]|nr:hypothetical protein [Deltaproteobacteria bacterium]